MSERDPELLKWTEAEDGVASGPEPDVQAMFAELQARIDGRPTTARLADLSSPVRLGLTLAFAAVITAGVALFSHRADLHSTPMVPLIAACGVFAVVLLWAGSAALRPAHVPSLTDGALWSRLGLGLGVGFVMAFLPLVVSLVPAPMSEAQAAMPMWQRTMGCLSFGIGSAVPLYVLLRAMGRGQRMSPWLSAVAAGAMGNLALQLHCGSGDPIHRLSGHATVGLVLVAVTALLLLTRNARKPGHAN
ncbi:MAG: hypothetical protein OXU20_02825 [Myxococcales bacterium]|nr:hypothetical protein [Myxococcales bacterium]MDD9966938.1 hypothetical protein [Myxococcales bacterium]